MKGYKLLSNDMKATRGNNMKYELGKEYEIEGKLIPCDNGFHFCENIEDTLIWYSTFEGNKLFEIDTLDGDVIEADDRKMVSSKIKLIREIDTDEFMKDNWERLINDDDWCVRYEVARQGYGLDRLVNDCNYRVRREVAGQGYGLDRLVNDCNYRVRREVAGQGYGLDVLINDESWDVRFEARKMMNKRRNKNGK